MKYLLFFLALCIGCATQQSSRNVSACSKIANKGYNIDVAACSEHYNNPKYNLGETLKFNANTYATGCTFLVKSLGWGAIRNLPYYIGDVSCPLEGTVLPTRFQAESNLSR